MDKNISNTDSLPESENRTNDPKLDLPNYKYPSLDLLESYDESIAIDAEILEVNKHKIVQTFSYSKIEILSIRAIVGPTLTRYEFVTAPGARVTKIKSLKDDLALILAADINIIGPIPGMGTMGIEVPHKTPGIVSIRSILATEKFQMCDFDLPIALGRTMNNEVTIVDLTKLPHLLISGATGQGKSVCLNAILFSLIYKKHPSQLKFVLIDINKLELSLFLGIQQHFLAKLPGKVDPIITDKQSAIDALTGLTIELDLCYDLLKNAGLRHIKEYNQKFTDQKLDTNHEHRFLPFIVVMIDEFAELLTANKQLELLISRLVQLGRAAGIHLIISTQQPSVKIITGTIKANFTSRLAFRVSSPIESRTILDHNGAELLNGNGDMLLSTGAEIIRLQGAFVDTKEVLRLNQFIGYQQGYPEAYLLSKYVTDPFPSLTSVRRDSLFSDAARLIVMHQQGSTSLIQRKLKINYDRASHIIDQLEATGVIGPFCGSNAREVKIHDDYDLEVFLHSLNLDQSTFFIPEPIKAEPKQTKVTPIDTPSIKPKTDSNKGSFWNRFFSEIF
ncbi:DNA translocase FtsK [Pedobacter gandavensis]|uniref:DNA translocase FtsK n=1 Tax=Pedobacter gandavensis TaxID=2679963 RepID=UPI0032AE9772